MPDRPLWKVYRAFFRHNDLLLLSFTNPEESCCLHAQICFLRFFPLLMLCLSSLGSVASLPLEPTYRQLPALVDLRFSHC